MRKLIAGAALVGLVTVGGAGAAFAGEVNGRGKPTPISEEGGFKAGSICAFSGLNDMKLGQGPIDFIVQSPGQDVRTGLTPPGVPGEACGPGTNPDNP